MVVVVYGNAAVIYASSKTLPLAPLLTGLVFLACPVSLSVGVDTITHEWMEAAS